jgi:hypothetical protein
MNDWNRAQLASTMHHVQQSNLPRECKAVIYAALGVYQKLMELSPLVWEPSEWSDYYSERSWEWLATPEEQARMKRNEKQ